MLCFGFYLAETFVKRNRTKTYTLYLTPLTSCTDTCLAVTKHFSSWPLELGEGHAIMWERLFPLSAFTTHGNPVPCTRSKGRWAASGKPQGGLLKPFVMVCRSLTHVALSPTTLPLAFKWWPILDFLLSERLCICYCHYPEHSFLSPLHLANSCLITEFSLDVSQEAFHGP